MAGRRKKDEPTSVPEQVAPNAVIASAARRGGSGSAAGRALSKNRQTAWWDSAFNFYDLVGEYRFAVTWVGNILSRAHLYIAKERDDGTGYDPVEDPRIVEQLDVLASGAGGQSEMLQRLGIILTVTGEAYVLGWTGDDGTEQWIVASPSEVTATRSGKNPDGSARWVWKLHDETLGEDVAVARVMRPHPHDSRKSDSPSRAALPILSEIYGLTQHVASQIDSRLAGAGVFLIPSETRFPPAEDGTPGGPGDLLDQLQEAMEEAIADRSSASARVPIIVSAPGEHLDKVQYLTFWTGLDENAIALRTEAIRRLALSMDMPPEVLTGVGDVNHWQAWSIDESAIKVHAMPPLQLIVSSLTVNYLQPRLEGVLGMDAQQASRYAILADTSQMRTRPNRSREALELYDRRLISVEATLREVGFDIDDAMTLEGLQRALLVNVASGSTTPFQVAAALEALGVDLPAPEPEPEETQEARPSPTLREHPDQGPPEEPEMLALAEPLVARALERAGNRMRNRNRGHSDVPARQRYMHEIPASGDIPGLLEGAWDQVAEHCDGRGIDPVLMTQTLDSYCRVLLAEGKPHDRGMLASYIRLLSTQATTGGGR